MFKEINLLLRPALSESMKVILWHECAHYKCWGNKKKKKKNGKIPVRCNIASLSFGIIIKAFISTAPLTSQPQAEVSQSLSSHSHSRRFLIRKGCLVYFAPFAFEHFGLLLQDEFLSHFLIGLINPAVAIVSALPPPRLPLPPRHMQPLQPPSPSLH